MLQRAHAQDAYRLIPPLFGAFQERQFVFTTGHFSSPSFSSSCLPRFFPRLRFRAARFTFAQIFQPQRFACSSVCAFRRQFQQRDARLCHSRRASQASSFSRLLQIFPPRLRASRLFHKALNHAERCAFQPFFAAPCRQMRAVGIPRFRRFILSSALADVTLCASFISVDVPAASPPSRIQGYVRY